METSSQNSQSQEGNQQQEGTIPFEVRYFDNDTYMKVFHTHVNVFQLFVSYLTQQGIQVDSNALSNLLNRYWEEFMKTGDSLGPVPEGSTCQHIFTKGSSGKQGKICGANAKHWGVEGKPKCTSHKNSKPSKVTPEGGVPSSSKNNSVFNYKDHKESGVVAAQNLTTLQNSIKEQVTPPQINLTRNEFGVVYNIDTRLAFVQKDDSFYYAVGVLADDNKTVSKLTSAETYLCYSNGWKWDKDCVEEEGPSEHPLLGGLDGSNPLVSSQSDLIKSKLNRFQQNN